MWHWQITLCMILFAMFASNVYNVYSQSLVSHLIIHYIIFTKLVALLV